MATVTPMSAGSNRCESMVEQADGKLLVAGSEGGGASRFACSRTVFMTQPFPADVVADAMTNATAMAVGGDGSILIAGDSSGISGAVIVRLQASGELDTLFGNAGATWVDLPTYYESPYPSATSSFCRMAERRWPVARAVCDPRPLEPIPLPGRRRSAAVHSWPGSLATTAVPARASSVSCARPSSRPSKAGRLLSSCAAWVARRAR